MDVVCDSPEEQHHSSLSGYNASVAVCDERIRYAQYDHLKIKFRLDNLVFRTVDCTEGWDRGLGISGLKYFLLKMVWGAPLGPTGRYSTIEPSVSTFGG